MDKLQNANRALVMRALAEARAQTRAGTVKSYDPTTHMAKVMISPELILTGWLPIHAMGIGNGFGVYSAPNIGDQVIVTHLEDDFGSGMVTGRLCDDDHIPPAVPSGETWLVHSSGSFLKFTNDGKVALTSHDDLNVTVGGKFNANVTGDTNLTVQGDANITATGNAVVVGDEVLLGDSGATLFVKLSDGSNATKVKAK